MGVTFKIIPKTDITVVVPLVYELNEGNVPESILQSRFAEMVNQNYECAGAYMDDELVGVCGLWYCTRHYIGKSVELDHVFIKANYRGQGIGKQFLNWLTAYVTSNGYISLELNTYVQNYPSHKVYYNEGFEILGYHFLKQL